MLEEIKFFVANSRENRHRQVVLVAEKAIVSHCISEAVLEAKLEAYRARQAGVSVFTGQETL
jgi:hypothetical protein